MFDSEAKLKLHLIYSPLPSFSLHALNGFEGSKGKVLYLLPLLTMVQSSV